MDSDFKVMETFMTAKMPNVLFPFDEIMQSERFKQEWTKNNVKEKKYDILDGNISLTIQLRSSEL